MMMILLKTGLVGLAQQRLIFEIVRKNLDGDSSGMYVLYLDICQSLLLVRLNIPIAAAGLLLAPVREEVATKIFF